MGRGKWEGIRFFITKTVIFFLREREKGKSENESIEKKESFANKKKLNGKFYSRKKKRKIRSPHKNSVFSNKIRFKILSSSSETHTEQGIIYLGGGTYTPLFTKNMQ